MVADSLQQAHLADSLHKLFIEDSLAVVRIAAREAIFGEGSELCVASRGVAEVMDRGVESLSHNPLFMALATIFALLYLLWLPHVVRNGSIKWAHFKHHHTSHGDEREIIGQQRMGVLVVAWALFTTLFSMIIARGVAQYATSQVDFSGGGWIGIGLVGVVGVALYGWAMLRMGGYLSLSGEFVRKILSMKRQLMILCAIFASPLFIISALANYNQGEWVLQLSGFVGVIFIFIFLRESFLLFVRQNFSILHWFLYLCGVEILPLTFIWAITTRYLVG